MRAIHLKYLEYEIQFFPINSYVVNENNEKLAKSIWITVYDICIIMYLLHTAK